MKTLSFEKKYPNFKKDYPSFSEDPFVSEGWMWEEDKEVVIKYCLDKQRVREAIDKLKRTDVWVGDGCLDDADYDIIKVEELLEELGL